MINRKKPKLLYHGTTKKYHDESISQFDCYKSHGPYAGDPIYLIDDPCTAVRYALFLAKTFKNIPIVLKAESKKLHFSPIPGHWMTDFLHREAYTFIEIKLKAGDISRISMDDILESDPRDLLSDGILNQLL